ncbi:hypothetical protein MUP65_00440, partial [Patescibacteria group bacterium]|nr:hypothetical protein [Patescibacteria group bacterium]
MSKKLALIAFRPDRLRAVLVSVGKDKIEVKIEVEKTFPPHDFGELSQVLQAVKKELKISEARVLIPEEKAYLKLLVFDGNTELTREMIRQKAQESIPEILKEGSFDWRHVDDRDGKKRVQVMMISEVYLKFIRQAAQGAGLKITAFESPSLSIARLVADKGPTLILHKDGQTLVSICEGGVVLESALVEQEDQVEEKINQLKEHVQQNLGLEVHQTLSEGINPLVGLALKEDLKGQDEKVLNLPAQNALDNISSVQPERQEGRKMEEQPQMDPQVSLRPDGVVSQPSKKGKTVLLGLVIVLVLVGLGVGGYFLLRKDEPVDEPLPLPSPPPVVTPIIEPTDVPETIPTPALERGDLSVQILN